MIINLPERRNASGHLRQSNIGYGGRACRKYGQDYRIKNENQLGVVLTILFIPVD
jgi:hypothetical protein